MKVYLVFEDVYGIVEQSYTGTFSTLKKAEAYVAEAWKLEEAEGNVIPWAIREVTLDVPGGVD